MKQQDLFYYQCHSVPPGHVHAYICRWGSEYNRSMIQQYTQADGTLSRRSYKLSKLHNQSAASSSHGWHRQARLASLAAVGPRVLGRTRFGSFHRIFCDLNTRSHCPGHRGSLDNSPCFTPKRPLRLFGANPPDNLRGCPSTRVIRDNLNCCPSTRVLQALESHVPSTY